jgi:hypothetical protein
MAINMNKKQRALIISSSLIAGLLFLYFLHSIGVDIQRYEVVGKWCNDKNNGRYLILKDDSTFFVRDRYLIAHNKWEFKSFWQPLGPSLSISDFPDGEKNIELVNGVFPISRDNGHLIFTINADNDLFYWKCGN